MASTEFKQYSKCTVYIDGKLLAEEASVTLKASSGLSKVYTVNKGFAGVSKGSEEMAITIDSAVPTDGFEYLPANMPSGSTVNCSIFCGSKTLSSSAIVMDYSVSHSVGDHAKISLDLAAQYTEWQ